MKVKGGRTIYTTKNGDIIYESIGKDAHKINFSKEKKRYHPIKFEERFRRSSLVPIKSLYEFKNLVDIKPFSLKSGKAKYLFYEFNEESFNNLTRKKQIRVRSFFELRKNIGCHEAFKALNKNRDLSKLLKPFEDQRFNLDEYWVASLKKFLGMECVERFTPLSPNVDFIPDCSSEVSSYPDSFFECGTDSRPERLVSVIGSNVSHFS